MTSPRPNDSVELYRGRASPSHSPAAGPSKPKPKPEQKQALPASLTIELSSGSDNDDDRAAPLAQAEQSRLAKRFEDRNLVRAAIPDVDPLVILDLFKDPTYRGDPNLIAEAILETNYRLRDGGWKWGYDPEVGPGGGSDNAVASGSGPQKKQKHLAAAGNDSESDSDGDRAPPPPPRAGAKQKRVRRHSSDEDEDEQDDVHADVDQLASDHDDNAGSDDDDEEDLMYEDVMDQEGYWLDVENRDPPEDTYRKAALNRLFRVFNQYAEIHIRDRFESDANDYFFAPAFLDLKRLQERGELLKLKGQPRDMDGPIVGPDGSKRARKPVEKSKTLEKESRWLTSYLRFGGKGLGQNKAAKANPPKKPQNESPDARRARLSGGQAPARQQQPQKKKKKMVASPAHSDDDDDDAARSSSDDLTPIASTSVRKVGSKAGKSIAKPKSRQQAKENRVRFDREDEGECSEDLYSDNHHPANSAGWGPAYQDKPSTTGAKGKKKKELLKAGSWASSSSGPIHAVKEEDREWFIGDGRRLDE
ncbi:hypothetical protein JCM3774_002466 [Rhodotorula dairenensis]